MNALEAIGLLALIFFAAVGFSTCSYLAFLGLNGIRSLVATGRLESEAAIRDRILERSAR